MRQKDFFILMNQSEAKLPVKLGFRFLGEFGTRYARKVTLFWFAGYFFMMSFIAIVRRTQSRVQRHRNSVDIFCREFLRSLTGYCIGWHHHPGFISSEENKRLSSSYNLVFLQPWKPFWTMGSCSFSWQQLPTCCASLRGAVIQDLHRPLLYFCPLYHRTICHQRVRNSQEQG